MANLLNACLRVKTLQQTGRHTRWKVACACPDKLCFVSGRCRKPL